MSATSITKVRNASATISFNPTLLHKRFGADYGERYHTDPLYRIDMDARTAKRLHEAYGAYGVGNPDPQPCMAIGIQPLDFLNIALGGRVIYKETEDCWTPDKPLAHLDSIEAVNAMSDIDWNAVPMLQQYWEQVDILQRAYPNARIEHIQGVGAEGLNVMHTPYTTAFRLLGDEILDYMMLEEDLANAIFDYIMRQYKNLWTTIRTRMGWAQGDYIHFGDCAATMLSPTLYASMSLPRYLALLKGDNYRTCNVHSCGPSTHLLELFSHVPNIASLQLGDGTDISKVRPLFSETFVCAYFNASNMMTLTPVEIEARVWNIADMLQDNFNISASSIDPNTPEENILAFLKTAHQLNTACAEANK